LSAVGGEDVLTSAAVAGPSVARQNANGNGTVLQYLQGADLALSSNDLYVSGDRTYHWRDIENGVQRGSVNSIDFTLHGSTTDGIVTISRLPTHSTLAPARPTGHTFIGLWSFNSTAEFDSATLKVRYDEMLAQSLGLNENILKLWVYDNDQWIRITGSSFSRDLLNHTPSGEWGNFSYIGVSAPDPASSLGLVGLVASWLLRRRRDR
jgi:uncharacterized protein (TIGR03382 family)